MSPYLNLWSIESQSRTDPFNFNAPDCPQILTKKLAPPQVNSTRFVWFLYDTAKMISTAAPPKIQHQNGWANYGLNFNDFLRTLTHGYNFHSLPFSSSSRSKARKYTSWELISAIFGGKVAEGSQRKKDLPSRITDLSFKLITKKSSALASFTAQQSSSSF